jgi:hypothetical protein
LEGLRPLVFASQTERPSKALQPSPETARRVNCLSRIHKNLVPSLSRIRIPTKSTTRFRRTHGHLPLIDRDRGGNLDEVTENAAGMSVSVAAHLLGEKAVEAAGDHQERHVEVDLEADGWRERVHVEKAGRLGERVFDEHALGPSAGIVEGRWTPRAAKQALWFVAHLTPQSVEELYHEGR